LLVILSWLLLMIAILIRINSPGPVLFRQTRIGRSGKSFQVLKFRTMKADRRRQNIGPPAGYAERRVYHKSRDPSRDARITRVGRLLRRSSLDELPQLWNVLKGDMSLVGPRPELPYLVAQYEPWQHLRHLVRPGITGWWQVNRGDGRLMHEATELDIHYVHHQSLRLDVSIILRTFGAVIRGSGSF
jgi:lipopolysaccharide/colanic/teichoic acid biosynthesis glycosyltransferase